MPIEKIHRDTNRAWALWYITENETALLKDAAGETIPETLTNPYKRLEHITGRVLVKNLMTGMGLKFNGIRKDEYGKPFPSGSDYQLSLSHSYPYVAALIDSSKPVGIDLEQPKPKLLKIAPRVLSKEELADASDDLVKHCIFWCAKEAMIKVYGKKDLVFAENLLVEPFQRSFEGHIVGRIIVRGNETKVALHYSVHNDFVVVMNV
jgi:4'-phosphopantetheinyl transferase